MRKRVKEEITVRKQTLEDGKSKALHADAGK